MKTQQFNIGDTVIYSTSGICRVKAIVQQAFNYENRNYYELEPIFDARSTCFVPVDYDSEKVHIEKALSKEQAAALLDYAATAAPTPWIALPNERKQQYNLICRKGSRKEKVRLIKALQLQEQKQKAQNKQLYAADERIFSGCKAQIQNELAYVLGKSTDEIEFLFESLAADTDKS